MRSTAGHPTGEAGKTTPIRYCAIWISRNISPGFRRYPPWIYLYVLSKQPISVGGFKVDSMLRSPAQSSRETL